MDGHISHMCMCVHVHACTHSHTQFILCNLSLMDSNNCGLKEFGKVTPFVMSVLGFLSAFPQQSGMAATSQPCQPMSSNQLPETLQKKDLCGFLEDTQLSDIGT